VETTVRVVNRSTARARVDRGMRVQGRAVHRREHALHVVAEQRVEAWFAVAHPGVAIRREGSATYGDVVADRGCDAKELLGEARLQEGEGLAAARRLGGGS